MHEMTHALARVCFVRVRKSEICQRGASGTSSVWHANAVHAMGNIRHMHTGKPAAGRDNASGRVHVLVTKPRQASADQWAEYHR